MGDVSIEELELVWSNIQPEAQLLADCESTVAVFHVTLLKHENLDGVLSYILANKLSKSIMPIIILKCR